MSNDKYKKLQTVIDKIIKRKKNPFLGPLSPNQASEGIKAALTTAKELLEDSLLLFNNNRYARATSLAILAIEEFGKIDILRRIVISKEGASLKPLWKEYRDHLAKSALWLRPFLEKAGLALFDQLAIVHQEDFEHSRIPDDIKQAGFYSDISDNGWQTPQDLISERIAKFFIATAQRLIPKEAGLSTPAGLELMVKHIKPVDEDNAPALKAAWISLYAEAEALGLVERGAYDKMKSEFDLRKDLFLDQ